MTVETIHVWRYDSGLHTTEETEVYADTPLDYWLPVMVGEGSVIYTATKLQCLKYMQEDLKQQIGELQTLLLEIDAEIEDIRQ